MDRKKFVLLTGAAGGIGMATAAALRAHGMEVLAGVLNEAEADLLVARLGREAITPILLDVRDEASIAAALDRARAAMPADGRLYALVSNAGVNINAPLGYLGADEIRLMIDVNLLGTILMVRAVLPLLAPGWSRVVLTGSATGFVAAPITTTYAATKFGIEGFADAMRLELGAIGVPLSLIEPGVMRTPMTETAPAMLEQMLGRMTAADRTIYEPAMRKVVSLSAGPDRGNPPEVVAATIIRALTVTRPARRYPVGMDAKAARILGMLPAALRDWVQRKTFGI